MSQGEFPYEDTSVIQKALKMKLNDYHPTSSISVHVTIGFIGVGITWVLNSQVVDTTGVHAILQEIQAG